MIQQKTTSEKQTPKGLLQKRGVACPRPLARKRRNRRYRNRNRYARYKQRLLERKFCLDANLLTSKGFFKGGVGGYWLYTCSNEYGYMGQAKIALLQARRPDEVAIRIEPSPVLLADASTVRASDEGCRLGGVRWWFYCPQCRRKVFTLFYHLVIGSCIENTLACRRCHRLLYLSQVRGINRVGFEEFEKNKKQYKVVKSLCKNVT